jgi:alpha-galactosidase
MLSAAGLTLPLHGTAAASPVPRLTGAAGSFLDLRRPPDLVTAQTADGDQRLAGSGGREWQGKGLVVTTIVSPAALGVRLAAPGAAVRRIHLRWRGDLRATRLLLGDAWERGYGDLEWRGFVPDRMMPWYFGAWDGQKTHGYGVRTGPKAFCFWQADPDGISLWADVRSGGVGVQLGQRELAVCEVVAREGKSGESPFAALHAFCRQMCPDPRLPAQPVYGHNDWYYAYGKNSAASFLADAQRIVELSPPGGNRPFAVLDDGWQPERGAERKKGVGLWDRGNEKFPDMPAAAAAVRGAGARPGIWIRPLLATEQTPDAWRLSRDHAIVDPTVPEVLAKVGADIHRLGEWGFDLVKHDYSTVDVLGRWGSQMGAALTNKEGWTFATGPDRTTAEVIDDLYRTIREAAGDTLVIGCNTVSHLSAGRFEMCRVGDDTSGTDWGRTRKMGVNSLAFRGVQHDAFYTVDADCVGVTNRIPWALNRQWLDLLARSGTMLFVSLAPDAVGADERRDLRAALALAARPQPLGQPLDWQETIWPTRWRLTGGERSFDWIAPEGVGLP